MAKTFNILARKAKQAASSRALRPCGSIAGLVQLNIGMLFAFQ